jgi:flagellar biosynthesis protein
LSIAGKPDAAKRLRRRETKMLDDTKRKVPQTAVALAYQSGTPAPKVVAKGSGLIAEQIISTAREHGVFVHESKELVALLMDVDLDRRFRRACIGRLRNCWPGYIILNLRMAGRSPPPDTSSLPTDT